MPFGFEVAMQEVPGLLREILAAVRALKPADVHISVKQSDLTETEFHAFDPNDPATWPKHILAKELAELRRFREREPRVDLVLTLAMAGAEALEQRQRYTDARCLSGYVDDVRGFKVSDA